MHVFRDVTTDQGQLFRIDKIQLILVYFFRYGFDLENEYINMHTNQI